jgi:hypothetical protein
VFEKVINGIREKRHEKIRDTVADFGGQLKPNNSAWADRLNRIPTDWRAFCVAH